jgi:serine/threonine protein kinase
MRRLEESGILRPDALRHASEVARETHSHTLLGRRLVALGMITSWQARQLLAGRTRLRLGKYVLRAQIGRGDFGRVFLAEHTQLRREVAIKTLSRQFTQYPEIVDRFLADAREAAALDHRNILHVFDVDSCNGRYFLVMEYVQGSDLRRLVDEQGPRSATETANLLRQAAAGLAYAHERGVWHRDLQPANLMVDAPGVVKILGFGMGRLAGAPAVPGATATGLLAVADSPYWAPEQRADGPERCDVRTDIYALGCIAHFLLTGRPPAHTVARDGGAPPGIAQARDVFEAAEAAECEIPAEMLGVLRRMTALDPDERFDAVVEVGRALQEWDASPAGAFERNGLPVDDVTGAFAEAAALHPPLRSGGSSPRLQRTDFHRNLPVDPAAPSRRRRISLICILVVLCAAAALMYGRGWSEWAQPGGAADASRAVPNAPPLLHKRVTRGPDPTTPQPDVGAASALGEALASVTEPAPPPTAVPAELPDSSETPPASAAVPHPQPEMVTEDAAPANPPAPPVPPADAARAGEPSATEPATPPPSSSTETAPPSIADSPPADAASPDPLGDLPVAVDLPILDSAIDAVPESLTVELGRFPAEHQDGIVVQLLGGPSAGVPAAGFELERGAEREPVRWLVWLVSQEPAGPVRHPVAELRCENGGLSFRWDPAARSRAGAQHVRNCVLRFTHGAHRHDVRLRQPLPVDPLQLNLKRPSVTVRAKLPDPPEMACLRFQVTAINEPWPQSFTLTPPEPVAMSDGRVRIDVGSEAEPDVLTLDLMAGCRAVFQLTCEASFCPVPKAERTPLSVKKLQEAEWIANQSQLAANARAQQIRAAVAALPVGDPVRAIRENELRQAEADLAQCSQVTQRMETLTSIREAVAQGARIHFRVFALVEDCEVDILRSDPAAMP